MCPDRRIMPPRGVWVKFYFKHCVSNKKKTLCSRGLYRQPHKILQTLNILAFICVTTHDQVNKSIKQCCHTACMRHFLRHSSIFTYRSAMTTLSSSNLSLGLFLKKNSAQQGPSGVFNIFRTEIGICH